MASSDKATPSRLATLKTPRDLTLGGKGLTRGGAIKRKFAPVIPTSSNNSDMSASFDTNSEHNTSSEILNKRPRRSEGQKPFDRGHQNNRGRGKGRYTANLIQTRSSLEATLKEWALNSKKEKFISSTFSGGHAGRNKREVNDDYEVINVLEDLEESMLKDEFFALSIPKNEEAIQTMNPLSLPPKQKHMDSVPQVPADAYLSEDKKSFHTENFYRVILPSSLPIHNKQQANQTSEDTKEGLHSLSQFPEGLIGKIRFMRSGKVSLILGENELTLKGASSRYYQEAKMLDTRMNPPEHIDLGQVQHCLDFRPDLMSFILKEYQAITLNNQRGGDKI